MGSVLEPGMRFVSEREIREVLDVKELIEVMRRALVEFSSGRAVQPVRTHLDTGAGRMYLMPAAMEDALGVKVLTFFAPNAERGEPTHHAWILMFDPASGAAVALLEAEAITAWRTAAVSALATDLLASEGASVLAILGSGVQARSHVVALRTVRNFAEVRVWSRTPAHAKALARELGAKEVSSARDAVTDADVIVTATSTSTAVLEGKWLKPGCHVNAVGAASPNARELDDQVMAATVYVDSRAAAVVESGDVIHSGATIYAELGEALAGVVKTDRNETTLFKSLGIGVEDVATATWVLDRLNQA